MTRRPRLLIAGGVALCLVGIGLLGFVAWQFWGTNWVSQRDHREIVEALQDSWEEGNRETATDHGTADAIVRIPAFGEDYAVPVLEGTGDGALASGLGHFVDSAGAGQIGNFALAGHRVTHGEPLRRMPELEPGDEVVVETREAVYTYELTSGGDDLEVPFTETWVVAPRPENPDEGEPEPELGPGNARLLTLTTCAELFHTDQRLVAFGVLRSTERR